MATRRLNDLYIVGKELTFDDGQGEPITVFIRKMNPVDHEAAVRLGNAARARTIAIKNNPDSNAYQDIMNGLIEYSREELIEYLGADHRNQREPIIRAELASDDEWQKDGYLEGLQESWRDGLEAKFIVEPEDHEAKSVYLALKPYEDKVAEALKDSVDDFMSTLEEYPDEVIQSKVFDKMLDIEASMAWFMEFRRSEVWLSTREPDKINKYFHDRAEVDGLPIEVFEGIQNAYREISVDVIEGKDSPAEVDSSPSSEPVEQPETDTSSGPEAAAA